MKRIILIHGISTDGKSDIFLMTPLLKRAGFEVIEFHYPYNNIWETFSKKRSTANAKRLKEIAQKGDHVIAHSNGARVAYRAMVLGVNFDQIYLFAPAFAAKAKWPNVHFNKLNIIHNFFDIAIMHGALLPFHEFGLLGSLGYQGPHDSRIHSISNRYKDKKDRFNHSQYFRNPERLKLWTEYIIQRLNS